MSCNTNLEKSLVAIGKDIKKTQKLYKMTHQRYVCDMMEGSRSRFPTHILGLTPKCKIERLMLYQTEPDAWSPTATSVEPQHAQVCPRAHESNPEFLHGHLALPLSCKSLNTVAQYHRHHQMASRHQEKGPSLILVNGS